MDAMPPVDEDAIREVMHTYHAIAAKGSVHKHREEQSHQLFRQDPTMYQLICDLSAPYGNERDFMLDHHLMIRGMLTQYQDFTQTPLPLYEQLYSTLLERNPGSLVAKLEQYSLFMRKDRNVPLLAFMMSAQETFSPIYLPESTIRLPKAQATVDLMAPYILLREALQPAPRTFRTQ